LSDEPTKERLRHAGDDVERRTITVPVGDVLVTTENVVIQDVLGRLFAKSAKHPIDGDSYAAGRQWQHDWDQSGAGKISAVDTSRDVVQGGQFKDMTAKAIDAYSRYKKARKAVGHDLSHVLFHILLMDEEPSEYGRKWLWHTNPKLAGVEAKAVLRVALKRLAFVYYGETKPVMASHHEPGYRPQIQPLENT